MNQQKSYQRSRVYAADAIFGREAELNRLLRGAQRSYSVGRLEPAKQLCQIAVRYYPACADAHNLLGEIADAQGRQDQAALHFEAALRSDCGKPQHWISFCKALLRTGQLLKIRDVVRLFSRTLFEGAASEAGRASLIERFLQQAQSKHETGDLDDAELMCECVLLLNKKHGDAFHMAGMIAFQRGEYSDAVGLLRLAIDHSGCDAVYHSDLGCALLALHELDAAMVYLRRSIELDPGNVLAGFCLDRATCGAAGRDQSDDLVD